jgi:nucleotide-binding universal stress UspA family protein
MKQPIVLVATDFSSRSFDVIEKAFAFANSSRATVHVVHAIERDIFTFIQDEEEAKTNAYETLKAKFPDLPKAQFHCEKGRVEDVLAACANTLSARVLFLGSSGEKEGLRDLFMGSSTKAIVRALSAPVLVVKTHQAINANKILIPTDFSEASRWHIHAVRTLFPKAAITLLHVYTVPFGNRLSLYGIKRGEVNDFGENLRVSAENEAMLFLESLGEERENVDLLVREGELDSQFFTSTATMHGIELIALHTTGKVSFFAFDLLQETDKDVLITTI